MLRRSFVLIFALMMLIVSCAQAESGSFQTIIEPLYDETTAYILNAPVPPEKPGMAHDIVNILMIGVDYGILTSGRGKEDIKNCHTDCVMMIALDRTAKRISLISIPRDTITYVPGVHGVYKLNNAFNCAGTLEEGIQSTVNTVTWLMGGIRPDHYLLITPHLVELIGDAIGGLDIDVEMRYTGHSGTPYQKGFQHLNGVGIMDYSRARKNATVNNNDYGRTNRQRVVMTALIEKVSALLLGEELVGDDQTLDTVVIVAPLNVRNGVGSDTADGVSAVLGGGGDHDGGVKQLGLSLRILHKALVNSLSAVGLSQQLGK